MRVNSDGSARGVSWLDLRIGACVLLCLLVCAVLEALGAKFPVGEMRLDVIQKMTACISCLLCCQDARDASLKAGVLRVEVTAVGAVVGLGVVALDNALGSNPVVLALLCAAGVVATMVACRLVRAPAFNARIGAISLLLVACTLSGEARLWYALFRVISTVFGACVVVLVTWLFEKYVPGSVGE